MLAIIPARGGSKGIINKNIKPFCGHPLIYYTIAAAQAARSIDRLILSTDDEAIADVGSKYGVEIPFLRPSVLAQDNSLAIDNYVYTIDRLNASSEEKISEFIVLQPTSPLREASDIDKAISLFTSKKADSVISVCEYVHPPVWAKKIDARGGLVDYFDLDISRLNRQDLEAAYLPNGAIYVFRFSLLKLKRTYFSVKTYPYIMPHERSVDIDTAHDFEFAEFLMRRRRKTHAYKLPYR